MIFFSVSFESFSSQSRALFPRSFVACLEVVDWLDDFEHLRRRADVSKNAVHGLVDHWGLVYRLHAHGGGEDSFHLALEFVKAQVPPRLHTAHHAAGSMRRGEIPVLVSLPHADEASVAHVDWDEELLPFLRAHGPLPQNHRVGVDVVVDRGELLKDFVFGNA